MFSKLKDKWQVESNIQLIVIFFVFSLSGSLSLVMRKFVFELIHFDSSWPFIFKAIIYILTIVPLYQISLILLGSLLGQFEFFWRFEKKMLRRFGIRVK